MRATGTPMRGQDPMPLAKRSTASISIVKPIEFDSATAQTSGSTRRAAITPALGIETTQWGGLFDVEPGARTGIHHHGEQQTIAYVLSGRCEVRWGANGEYAARAEAGDFIHVPAYLLHMEINPSSREPFRWVVVRSTPAPIVVNFPDDTWSEANSSINGAPPAPAGSVLVASDDGRDVTHEAVTTWRPRDRDA